MPGADDSNGGAQADAGLGYRGCGLRRDLSEDRGIEDLHGAVDRPVALHSSRGA